jgi:5-methylcytosine-specific restriction endonuclease McrA
LVKNLSIKSAEAMGKYRFSTFERLAIWEAFEKKCAYSREPISYSDLHIDHILPERLLQNPKELSAIKERLELGPEFAVNSYYNWIPTHSGFNLQKGGMTFDESTSRYFLEIAKKNYDKTVSVEQRYKRVAEQEKMLLPLSAAIESGAVSRDDALRYLGTLSEKDSLLLLSELAFCDRRISGEIGLDEAESLLDLAVRHGDPGEEGLLLVGGGGEIRVHTCSEFFAAKAAGFYASTTYAMKMESFFNETCGAVKYLSIAEIPEKSYITAPRVGILDLDLLPLSVLSTMAPDQDDDLKAAIASGKSIQDWVNEGHVHIKRVSQYSIHLEHRMGQVLQELLRADFNGDGVEDILVYSYCYAIGGTFGYGDVFVLARLGESEQFSVLAVK